MYLTPSRRSAAFLGLLLLAGSTFFLYNIEGARLSLLYPWSPYQKTVLSDYEKQHPDVRQRVERLRRTCSQPDPFEKEYGRANLRLSRAYEGSLHRLRQLLHKLLRGETITITAIGGSITAGHHVDDDEVWFERFAEWLRDFVGSKSQVIAVNGAAPATGSDYFSFCFPLHIPEEADLVIVELAVNDEAILEHVENMENLLRGLVELPHRPAIVLAEAMAFSNGGMGGGGGRMHLPVAQYYDVPVVNQRHPLASHFARYPQLIRPYFTQDYWGNPDTRHFNARGHRDLGMLLASLLRDAACDMLSDDTFTVPPSLPPSIYPPPSFSEELSLTGLGDLEAQSDVAAWQDSIVEDSQKSWPEQSRFWRLDPVDDQEVGALMPGMWTMPYEYGQLPRMRVQDGWNPNLDHFVPPFKPICLSTRSSDPRFNLTPTYTDGWEHWVHPDYRDKPYIMATEPGSRVSFELETNVGVIKMYSLRSRTFGLGTIVCWVDDDVDKGVTVTGWWDNDMNIGRFATIRNDLIAGRHTLTCEVSQETSDPGGGHEFRIISVMSV
ncbi:hypothetical protein TREMEDRAFT_73476 [Tremella mesenterica DSM 1558]|uniref:uncharacterized protein n=1 Tax=Tremella mesenterica (strain ATCC 24925 / CBS 8224 / DSM 1558 / NBRC 9311 / NRRL Y-6157 / RJB 2259-6 / UBC 559-6) TaxID=578456 RepID=UPI0003F49160|nr:uncharacterized protein TREMEDRAFT_73476 [Tremella mesenterica DSM 1558]EIW70457.1 hypothetical protein TREMEDRAFT_73476 [Tremella mesenterica DSM 1558]